MENMGIWGHRVMMDRGTRWGNGNTMATWGYMGNMGTWHMKGHRDMGDMGTQRGRGETLGFGGHGAMLGTQKQMIGTDLECGNIMRTWKTERYGDVETCWGKGGHAGTLGTMRTWGKCWR